MLERAGVVHAHTTRQDGPVAPALIARALGATSVAAAGQVHGNGVAVVEDGGYVGATDALVTGAKGVALLVRGADCPLLALAAPRSGVVAVAHSGWRGTVAQIAARTVEALCAAGATRDELVAAVFPGIGACCFEVGPDVHAAFADAFTDAFDDAAAAWFEPRGERWHLDLHAAIAHTLRSAGVDDARIELVPGCTACDGRFFSHRATGGAPERHGLAVMRSA